MTQQSHSWNVILEMKISVYTKTCTQLFIADLFLIALNWTQQNCPSINQWLNRLWSIHTMKYYSALKMNELLMYRKLGWISKAL